MKIGDIFKEKLGNLSQEPADSVWKTIASSPELAKFNAQAHHKRVKRIVLASSLAIFAIVATSILLINSSHTENFSTQNQNNYPQIHQESTNEWISTDTTILVSQEQANTNANKKTSPKSTETETINLASNTTHHSENPIEKQVSHTIDYTCVTTNVPQETLSPTKASPIITPLATETISAPKTIATNDTEELPLVYSHDTSICRNAKLLLFVSNAQSVSWNIGQKNNSIEIYPEEDFTYIATARKIDGRDTVIRIKVDVFDCGLYIPNAFTPNGDGLNDEFKIQVPEDLNISNFEMSIFEPSGRLIFHSKNETQGWDGNFQGGKSSQGTYFYVVTYKDRVGEKHVEKGQLILYR
ncbi:MAG: gliding motility-associated C-terminal domain-containing protein [Bacteroidales bacterium]|nr:gliding motility-associated C-terminal domain-containing protein [Bacteroidales bacterium]